MTHNPRMKWIALGIAFAIGLAIGVLTYQNNDGELTEQQFLVYAAAAFGAVIATSILWWRSLDELAREAHKTAWFWGGSIGLAVTVIPMVIITQMAARGDIELEQFSGTAGFLLGLSGGVTLPIVTTLMGYFVAWAIFWWQKR